MFAAGNRVYKFAVLIKNVDFQITKDVAMLLVIIDKRVGGTAGPGETGITLRPASVSVEILNGRRAFDETSILCHQIWCKSTQRRNVVDDPNAPSMSGEHQIRRARMHHEIAYSYRGKIASLVLRPVLTAID